MTRMIRMPGDSFRGSLPPLTDEQRRLEDDLRASVQQLAGTIGERNLFHYKQLVAAAEYIHATLAGFGYEVRRQNYLVSGQTCVNLAAEVRGTDKPEDILLIGAHYDSAQGSPGANDNATGVAALLALARAFARTKPSHTLRFVAFTNEEPPFFQSRHMGSRVYAQQSRARGEKILLMLSLETIGYYSEEPASQGYPFPFSLFYPPTANFIAFVSNMDNASWVRQLLTAFRRHAQFPAEGGALWEWIPGVAWSDHWSFWKEGYPAVMVTDTAPNRYPHYHTATDTPDKIDYARMARVVSGLLRVIEDVAGGSR
ncbi:MAG: M20/M25/M40 family metallo-hydrolase [Nitrospira sp.]|nr:M20/M25/M40 family metallo-hydrolase [Nitrospira sp.]